LRYSETHHSRLGSHGCLRITVDCPSWFLCRLVLLLVVMVGLGITLNAVHLELNLIKESIVGYSKKDWMNRAGSRSDVSCQVTHLTRDFGEGAEAVKSFDVLIKILEAGKINGSTTASGYIIGDTPAACFIDAPLYSVVQNIMFENEKRNSKGDHRYYPYGISFPKPYVYAMGGRPVIYDNTQSAKKYLPPAEHWRIVNFDLSNEANFIDWTHEREWRVPNQFAFDLKAATVLLPSYNEIKEFYARVPKVAEMVKCCVPLGAVYY
jgi:hypothetical protein